MNRQGMIDDLRHVGPRLADLNARLLMRVAADMLEHVEPASHVLGAWLSAALDDPGVAPEYKAAINEWFNAGQPLPSAETWDDHRRVVLTERAKHTPEYGGRAVGKTWKAAEMFVTQGGQRMTDQKLGLRLFKDASQINGPQYRVRYEKPAWGMRRWFIYYKGRKIIDTPQVKDGFVGLENAVSWIKSYLTARKARTQQ